MPVTLQDINIGTVAGDGTGTPGRISFDKINSNNSVLEIAIEDAERKAFVIPVTTEDGVVEVGDGIITLPMPYSFVLLEVRGFVKTEQSGDDIQIDVQEDGYSVLDSGGLVIPAGANTSVGYSPEALPAPVILADNSVITIDVVSVGSVGGAAGLKVTLIGYVIWTTF